MAQAWERAWAIFEQAVERPAAERRAYVEAACDHDEVLRRAVEVLLAADATPESPVDRSPLRRDGHGRKPHPEKVGAYRLLRRIGEGGMGVTYLAVRDDGSFQRRAAVKVVRPGLESGAMLRRLETERQILAALDHPNVARLYDGGSTADGLPYVVMEHVEGIPIDLYCERHELSIDARLELFDKVCAAVRYAHQNLVVHRDLKPSNVLVTAAGEPKLLDFGIAKLLNPELAAAALEPTATAARMMTPSYASPEQIRGEPITTASDVYSLGVLLYRLLTGRLPHDVRGLTPAEIERLLDLEPPRPSVAVAAPVAEGQALGPPPPGSKESLRRRLAGDLDAIVAKALRSAPGRRYGSVEELANDLRRYRGGLPVEARRGSWRYRTGKLLRRHRTAVGVAATVTVLLVGFAASTARQAARVERQRDQARRERNEKERVIALIEEVVAFADPYVAPGSELTVREAVRRSVPVLDGRLHDQPAVRAELLRTTGAMLARLGDYDTARQQLEEALAIRSAEQGEGSLAVADVQRALASVRKEQGDYEAAERLARQALATFRARLPAGSPELVAPLNELVSVLCYREEFAPAEEPAREALALARRLGDDHAAERIAALELAATLDIKTGRYREAATLLRESLALRRSVYGEDHPSQQTTMHNLALALRWSGELDAAERTYTEALAILRATYGEDHPEYATTLNNLAGVRYARGDYAGAEAAYREALAVFRAAAGPDHWRVFFLEVNIEAARLRNGHAADAERTLRRGISHWRERLGADHWLIAFADSLVGEALLVQGKLDEAGPVLEGSFRALVAAGAKYRYRRRALDALSELLRRQGREAEVARYEAMLGPDDA